MIPLDRKLNAFNRYVVSYLGVVGGVLLVLWLAGVFTDDVPREDRGITWWVSGALRLATFIGFAVLSFVATLKSQPEDPAGGEARSGPAQVKLRVVAAVCATLFFGDLAASAFADETLGWVSVFQAILLAICSLGAVSAVAAGRALLRLWADMGGGPQIPVWSEPTEMQANREVPSVGVHVFWLGAFCSAWVLGDELPALIGRGTEGHAAEAQSTVEGIFIALVGAVQMARREAFMLGLWTPRRRRNLDVIAAMLGVAMCAEIGSRLIVGMESIQPLGFWITAVLCFLGALAGGTVLARAAVSGQPRS